MNKKYIKYIAGLGVAIVLLVIIFPQLSPFSQAEKQQAEKSTDTNNNTKGVVIDALIVKEAPFENNIVLAGSLLANESVQLSSEISGKITRLLFKEGQYVKKGQLLLTTNSQDLQANLQSLQYTQKLNEQIEKRQKRLLESEAISKEDYDVAYTNLKTTEAEIANLKAQIAKTQITAPFSGYIGLRYVSEGSYISTATEIASLYNVDPIKLEFSVPSRFTKYIKEGQEVVFRSESEDQDRVAEIYALEPQIDPVTRTLKVRARAENNNRNLIPGQFVRVNLSLESNPDAILVPTTAIMPKANGHLVYVIKDGQAYANEVELGVRTATKVEIVQGLGANDTVAIAGVPQLKDGAAVQVKQLKNAKK